MGFQAAFGLGIGVGGLGCGFIVKQDLWLINHNANRSVIESAGLNNHFSGYRIPLLR
jgi:hypothetical protein